jgi:peptidoglycan-N-acetylglucosamine deacetylase
MVGRMLKRMLPRAVAVRQLSPRVDKALLLTFDDGPHAEVTPAVLDRLDAWGAKAVFFIVGSRVKRAPHLLAEIQKRGHRIGNHTYLHRPSYVLGSAFNLGFAGYYRDLRRCQAVVEEHTRSMPKLFRPPGGRLTLRNLAVPPCLGLRCVLWSQEVGDWRFRSSSEGAAGGEELLRRAGPSDIILLHDDNPSVLDLLDVLLPGLQARGYDLASGITHL